MWFDHEEGRGGWFSDLVGRDLGMAREDATDWIADRIGTAALPRPARQRSTTNAKPANDPCEPPTDAATAPPESNPDDDAGPAPNRADDAAERAARIWTSARPAPDNHP